MWNYIWPVLLVVSTNLIYHISTKETSQSVSPFLSLVVTYTVGAVVSLVLFLVTEGGKHDILSNFKNLNWASYLLGLAIVGLEAGYIYLYRAGWKIGLGSLVCNICAAVALMLIGVFLYKEHLGYKQVIGAVLCAAGLIFINS